jgi:hypothetical protein
MPAVSANLPNCPLGFDTRESCAAAQTEHSTLQTESVRGAECPSVLHLRAAEKCVGPRNLCFGVRVS